MPYSTTRLFSFLAIILCLFLAFASDVRACTCEEYGLPPCAAYWRADAVFVGSIIGITKPTEGSRGVLPQATLRFSIEQPYKGVKGTEVEVTTLWGTSCDGGDSQFKVGEQYLVYGHRDSAGGKLAIWPCDRTRPATSVDADLAYIRSVSNGTAKQTIIGRVAENKYQPLKGLKIAVEGAGKKYEAVTDDEGGFKVNVEQAGKYKVRAFIPFSAEVMSYRPNIQAHPTEKQTVVEYQVDLRKGECDYREVDVFKVDLKATAEISGRITDSEGKPVSSLNVYLYPTTAVQDFHSGDHEFAQTDETGKYTFAGLREGQYLVGVNIGRTPEIGQPYPQTFYPGVREAAQARVISLEQGQTLSTIDFSLPPRLVEREVTGTIVWPDGSPVTRMSPDSSPNLGPGLFILDPLFKFFPMNMMKKDGQYSAKVDKEGHFSFLGFEGYSYVIHVHAFNAEDKVMHAKHVRVTIKGEVQPIQLVLSLPGYGEGEEEIKKELNEQP